MAESDSLKTTEPLFVNLVQSLAAGALQQLGKLVNPATGKAETNLDAARISIDLIETLERKTRGNVSDPERRMLAETLTMLRLNYVETAAAPAATPASGAAPGEGGDAAPSAPKAEETPKAEEAPKAADAASGDQPRFHKSYG